MRFLLECRVFSNADYWWVSTIETSSELARALQTGKLNFSHGIHRELGTEWIVVTLRWGSGVIHHGESQDGATITSLIPGAAESKLGYH